MAERIACDACYQQEVCELRPNPLATSAAVEGGQRRPYMPANCFFHCCATGVAEAKDVYDQAEKDGETGLLPFESMHKPFVDRRIRGRYVARGEAGYQVGDVVVFVDGEPKMLTNIFAYAPVAITYG